MSWWSFLSKVNWSAASMNKLVRNEMMSVEVKHSDLSGAEKIFSPEEMYRLGIEASTSVDGGDVDLITAHKWFNLSASKGNELAREYRAQLTLEMSSREIAEAQRQAREWLAQNRNTASAI